MRHLPRYFFLTRRRFLQVCLGLGAFASVGARLAKADAKPLIKKTIPVSGESLPVIGMGSWMTFDVGDDYDARDARAQVLQAFFDGGGAVIDSSPMYGSSERVIGYCLGRVKNKDALFATTKVWTWGKWFGERQMEESRRQWGIERFDLMQIHNLRDWETHLETLKTWKADGKIRYFGITTSHGRRHTLLEQVMSREALDFVQFTYNVIDRDAEQRLLPLAAERGIAVIINRPFRGGNLFKHVKDKPLPSWAREFDCKNWAQFFLKFIVSHPHVTCAIPATSKVAHMQENMGANFGRLPDAKMRRRMVEVLR